MVSGGNIEASGTPEKVLTKELIRQVFDVQSVIAEHPIAKTPLVIT